MRRPPWVVVSGRGQSAIPSASRKNANGSSHHCAPDSPGNWKRTYPAAAKPPHGPVTTTWLSESGRSRRASTRCARESARRARTCW